ncbi:hypothetical protein KYN89_12840 [Alteriqipengyuania sp. NZ-12B]|uniref:Uncharacterized protein n=1 Tax=Alteriqipengyuania abyssalis TaxID=2860200 RepID=A0ABS7PI96_9SPHN|nr:hypothetical protein [Alteriqipengyuania abyssalis]MBY8337930.1 hypothetical protein [Alteriqipengyuania abyssalis]
MKDENLPEQNDEWQSRQQKHNQRVEAFLSREDLGDLTPREYVDAYADALRPQNIEMLRGAEHIGWMATSEVRHAAIRETFRDFNFELEPVSGWSNFLFELDLIFVQFDVPDVRKGYAELRREVDACIGKLEALRPTFFEFNHSIDFSVAAMLSKAATNDNIRMLDALIKSHKIVSAWLSEHHQAPRWREKTLRNSRIDLATRLLTIFHREFGLAPKPDGGSAHVPIEQANDWQRFYQACAFVRMQERETPDRQAVLWEAYQNW